MPDDPNEPVWPTELVWYASYASNCDSDRFQAYLSGETASGATRRERGARDPAPPKASAAMWFPAPVRFVGQTKKWGSGGAAFLDHGYGPHESPGRCYLITREQFEDVAAQESRRETKPLPVAELVPGEVRVIGDNRYDGLLALEPIDGIPMVTFTSPQPPQDLELNPPSEAYLGTIVRGLAEVHAISAEALADHLLNAPGVSAGWTAQEIIELLTK